MITEATATTEATTTAETTAAETATTAEATTLLTGDTTATEETATETTTTEDSSTEETAEKTEGEEETAEVTGAPEEYAEFTLAEGVALDETTLGEFKDVAKEMDLSQEKAQRFVDLATQMSQRWSQTIMDKAEQAGGVFVPVYSREEWLNAAKSDKEFGGDDLAPNLATAKRALDTYGTPEIKTFFDRSGLGNHPEMIRFMLRVGKTVSETSVVKADQTATGEAKSLAERMYPPKKSTKE
jgi:hypothetical protein